MAEPKTTKGTNGTHINGNHVSDKSTNKQSKLWQLLALAKEVTKDVDAVQDYEKSVEGRRALEQELESKAAENERLRQVNGRVVKEFSEYKAQSSVKTETLFAEFEHKYKTYESNKSAVEAMEKEVVEMREKLQVSEASQSGRDSELQKLKKLLQNALADVESHAAEIKEMGAECELHRSSMQTGITELETCKTQLTQAQNDLGEGVLHSFSPEELEKLALDLQALSKKCHSLVMEYFNDLDGAADAASEIQDLKDRFPDIPLTTDTTRTAALLRCAAAESVISDVLVSQIFVPFYLAPDLKASATKLLDIFGDDERRRTVYRCQVLGSAAHTDEATRIQEDIVRKASNEVRNTLLPLVLAFKQAGFHNAVPTLIREALALWAEVQHSRHLIRAAAPDFDQAEPAGRYTEYDQGASSSASTKGAKGSKVANAAKGEIAAVVFPKVSTGEEVVFNGMALWTNQGVFVATEAQESVTSGNEGAAEEPVKKISSPRRRKVSHSS